MDGETKRCTKCGIEKSLDDFYFDSTTLRTKPSCRACVMEYQNRRNAVLRGEDPDAPRERCVRPAQKAFCPETLAMQRDSAIAAVYAAARWWRESTDHEDRDLARQAAVFRARQLVEAQGRCEG